MDYIELIKKAKMAQNEEVIKDLLTKSQRNIFNFKESRDDIEQAYLDYSHIIYDFLLNFENQ